MIDKESLLALLREGENFISGQELCQHFGVSRNAIWKVMNGLRADGYVIEAVSNRGYRLVGTPDAMSKEDILANLETEMVARNVVLYDETDSTNIRIRRLAEDGAPEGTLAVADLQTAGRGRRGRGWIAPKGANIAMSLLIRPEILPNEAPMISLIAALAISSGIEAVTGLETQIKWPNDIVVNGYKCVGILTEMDMEADYIRNVIVGMGINVNEASKEEFEEAFREHTTSLRIECGQQVSRSKLISACMNNFERYYDLFLKDRNLSGLMGEYDKKLISVGKTVRVLDPAGEYEAISRGINNLGELIVELEDGTTREVYAGEVSVRGLYGYT